jgi:hypothetical protein
MTTLTTGGADPAFRASLRTDQETGKIIREMMRKNRWSLCRVLTECVRQVDELQRQQQDNAA